MKNNMILTVAAVGMVAIGAGVFFYAHNDSPPKATILSVNPNIVEVPVSQEECHTQTYTTTVKNPNRNFFNGMFDSSNHPKYIQQQHERQLCQKAVSEKKTQQGYVVEYQIGKHNASMIAISAPQVGSQMSIIELDHLAETDSNTAVVNSSNVNASQGMASPSENQQSSQAQ